MGHLTISISLHLVLLSFLAFESSVVLGVHPKNWGGLPDAAAQRAMPLNTQAAIDFDSESSPWVEKVGDSPQVYYFHNFLTDSERSHMIQVAAPQMRRSTVVGTHGDSVVDDIRTSYGMFIRRLHDPIIERIEKRISLWTHVPLENQEDIQILRYTKGQKYGAHYDSSYDKSEVGPKYRLATFYIYLSDVEEGGETAFPQNSRWTDPSMGTKGGPWSDCAKGNVAAKPKAGDAVLFYSYFPNGTMDSASMHTGCPVIKGIKWGAPVWIHVDGFRPEELVGRKSTTKDPIPTRDPGLCTDYNTRCSEWVASGECEKNKNFMMDTCRKACKACELCGESEWDCINRNRKKGGYLEIDSDEMKWLGVDLWQVNEPSPEL